VHRPECVLVAAEMGAWNRKKIPEIVEDQMSNMVKCRQYGQYLAFKFIDIFSTPKQWPSSDHNTPYFKTLLPAQGTKQQTFLCFSLPARSSCNKSRDPHAVLRERDKYW